MCDGLYETIDSMKVLAVDVGMGTQDILLFDDERQIENSVKMVLPSQTRITAGRIRQATDAGRDIVLHGTTMGGGPSTRAVRQHLQSGLNVYATKKAALTLHDNLEKVAKMGVVLIEENEVDIPDAEPILMCDVDADALAAALGLFETELPDDFAVAVQDHGEAPEMSNRIFRFRHFRQHLEAGGELERFAYLNNIPAHLTRMKSVVDTLKKENNIVLVMDTGPAAVCGALTDIPDGPGIVINIGNGHTLGAVVSENRILALFEHHTRLMDAPKLDDYIIRLCDGSLTFDEVFNDGGHGCHIREALGFKNIESVIVTGPNRQLMKGSAHKVKFAAPHGDMMLTGCFGLVEMFLRKTSV